MSDRAYLTIAEVLAIQYELIEEYGGVHGLRDIRTVGNGRIPSQVGYYADAAEKAAALMESFANNHPFVDGNKRVALAATHTFLLINGYDLETDLRAAYEFMMSSLTNGEFRFAQILGWIKSHIVKRF